MYYVCITRRFFIVYIPCHLSCKISYPENSIPLVNRIRSRWVWSRGKRYFVIAKLDPVKIAWIIREKQKGMLTNSTIAKHMGVSELWVKKHGKPASILTDRGSQFYANESEYKEKGITEFEDYLIRNDIRHILARVSHPQTNGKLERFYGEVERKLHLFKSVDELTNWWNNIKPHMSLNFDELETPSQAYIRKVPGEGIVIDEQPGEIYHAEKEE